MTTMAPPRVHPGVYYVPSRSIPAHIYSIIAGFDGELHCTCRGFAVRKDCSHCRFIREEKALATDTSTALVPIKVEPPKTILPSKEELNIIGTIAKTVVMARGHAVPASIDSPAKAAAVMLAGHELGVKPMTALRHIFVVNGRTEPDAQIMAGIVQSHEQDAAFEIVELTAEKCVMRLRRPSKGPNAVWEYTYEISDAEKAGLVKPGNPWSKFPKDMMRWACTKRLCRAFAPDLINSVGTVEVSAVSDLLAAADAEDEATESMVNLDALPPAQLYNDGDETPDDEPEPLDVTVADCKHVESFDEKRALKVCGICGIPLEGPDAPPQNQPGLGV